MKFLFKKGFEVFNSERYAVANPIVKRDYAETEIPIPVNNKILN